MTRGCDPRAVPQWTSGRYPCSRFVRLLALFAAFGLALSSDELDEYRVKAVFLYNFAKFVEWPVDAFTSSADPVAICVLGDKPFASRVRQLVSGQKIGERPLEVRDLQGAPAASRCHILFVMDAEWKRSHSVLRGLAEVSVLTVGESQGFVGAGGVINFKLKDERVRIEIDTAAASLARLRISAKLLSLAEAIRGREGRQK